MLTVTCPQCQRQIDLDSDPEIGQCLICKSCHAILEVTWLFPVDVDFLENSDPKQRRIDGDQA
jgi:hypothetical protein